MANSRAAKTRKLLEVAGRQHGVATTPQARDAEFSLSSIDRAVGSGRWKAIHRGIYVVDPAADPMRAAAFGHTLRAPGRTWASHRTAVWLWDLETSVPLRPEISTTANLRGGRANVRRLSDMPGHHTTTRNRIPLTSPSRTTIDLAAVTTPARLEAVVVEVTRKRLATIGELRDCADEMGGRCRGRRDLLRLLDSWDPAVAPESVLESRLTRLLRRGRLPLPETQFHVDVGEQVARLDFAYPREMVAIEADGYRWHGDPARWRADLARRNELSRLGWKVLHFTWNDVTARPSKVLATVRAALDHRSFDPEKRDSATTGRAT